jgi:hypothetical protein
LDDICDALSKAATCLSAAAAVTKSQRGSCAASAAKAACAANGGGNPSAVQQGGGTAVETGSAATACLAIKNPKAACSLASAGYALCMDRAFRGDDAILRALMATQCGTNWIMGCTGAVGTVSQPSHLLLHLQSLYLPYLLTHTPTHTHTLSLADRENSRRKCCVRSTDRRVREEAEGFPPSFSGSEPASTAVGPRTSTGSDRSVCRCLYSNRSHGG